MANVEISDLTLKTTPVGTDEIEIQETLGGLSKKTTLAAVGQYFGGLTLLAANTTYYVATTGNDTTGDGSSGSPWLTINYALSWVSQNIHANGYVITIDLANGTYTEDVLGVTVAGVNTANPIKLVGDATTPSNVVIRAATTTAILTKGTYLTIEGVQVNADTESFCIASTYGGILLIADTCEFGAAGNDVMYAGYTGRIHINADITLNGNAVNGLHAVAGGVIAWVSTGDIIYSGSPTFSGRTVLGQSGLIYKNVGNDSGTHTGSNLVEHNAYAYSVNLISANAWNTLTGGTYN
jgi:hypothetical protein